MTGTSIDSNTRKNNQESKKESPKRKPKKIRTQKEERALKLRYYQIS